MLLVDTNVLVDVLEDDPEWADWSIGQLRAQSQIHRLAINPIIYAELSLTFSTVEALDRAIEDLDLTMIEIPRPALFLASKAFVRYRRLGGTKQNVLADFFIGAHAAVSGYPVLTRDTARYATYFPTLSLVTPEQSSKIGKQ
jgi:predicted nucleic acid-binding protein